MRARLLGLFILLAVVPILLLGVLGYSRSLRALEALIATENARVASRVAAVLEQRAALLESDLTLLAENAETQRWLVERHSRGGDGASAMEADRFLRDAWSRMGASHASVTYRDSAGHGLYTLGQNRVGPDALNPVERKVRDVNTGTVLGSVVVQPILQSILPLDLLATGFGRTGRGMVIDRSTGRVLFHADPTLQGTELAGLIATQKWEAGATDLGASTGRFRYSAEGAVHVASWASVEALPWTVIVSGRLDEFSAPFTSVRRTTLFLFLAVATLAAIAFHILLQRTTRSLVELTEATAVIGQGDFSPRLPAVGHDEVGRLTTAFGAMATRVREMVTEIRTSRQMAVLGEFAANVAHEIRNPLTSIKLNLQKLDRERRAGTLSAVADQPLEIALREVGRLDGVVRGVLELGRPRPPQPVPCDLARLAAEAADTVGGQAAERGVKIELVSNEAVPIEVDPAQVRAAILNLVLNAIDAALAGGAIRLTSTAEGTHARLGVSDSGPGVPPERRAEIFRPFVTGKEQGTGLGLPLAKRAIEDNGGTLVLEDSSSDLGGAEFTLTFTRAEHA